MRRIPVSIALFAKPDSSGAVELQARIAAFFASRSVETRVMDSRADQATVSSGVSGCDLAVVIGGDGSMIAVGRRLMSLDVPIFGVNMGTLGFLTEVPAAKWQEYCALLLEEGFMVRERLALAVRLRRNGEFTPLPCGILPGAVNDVVFNRTGLARVVNLGVWLDGEPFSHFRGDGLIISSPVGSTGYAMSAGGAMLHPDIRAIGLAPVCPVLHSMPPLVVPETATVRVNQMQPWATVGVTVDGQDFFPLEPGDALEVCAAKQGTLFAVVRENSYWRQLALKGFVPPYAPSKTDSA